MPVALSDGLLWGGGGGRGHHHYSDHWGRTLDLDWSGHGLRACDLCTSLLQGEGLEELSAGGFIIESARLHPWVVSDGVDLWAIVTLV